MNNLKQTYNDLGYVVIKDGISDSRVMEYRKQILKFFHKNPGERQMTPTSILKDFPEIYEIQTNQIDKDKIIKKLTENSEALTKEKFGIDKNLNNQNFVKRAPKDLIEQNKNRQNAISLELSKIDSILSNLNG